ncbi:hypothetical protein ISS21_00330 [Patescibacteria group bacterium]|nr:hypothetical protein [Patescibacteria group bacterium]
MEHLDWRRRAFCFFVIFVLLAVFIGPLIQGQKVLAQDSETLKKLEATAKKAGLGEETDISLIVGRIISVVLGLISIILVVLLIVGGFMWMTAGGNVEQVTKAKTMMTNAFIALVIIVLAFAITRFVVKEMIEVTAPPPSS